MVKTNNVELLPLENSFSFCWTDVIAPRTDNRFTRDLILEAVPYSSANILLTCEIWDFGGIIKLSKKTKFLEIKDTQKYESRPFRLMLGWTLLT